MKSATSANFSIIKGTGSALPARSLTNFEISEFVETNHNWILERTGISERRISDPRNLQETNVGLAHQASLKALERAGLSASDLDAIVYATATPLGTVPAQACRLQGMLGATRAFAFDMNAACSGFLYGLQIADQFIKGGSVKNVLVVGSEVLSAYLNWRDRGTCILFGDGAGAAILSSLPQSDAQKPRGIISTKLRSDGHCAELIETSSSVHESETHPLKFELKPEKISMRGNEVFKLASRTMTELASQTLSSTGYKVDDVDWIVPHQANLRIIQSLADHLHFPIERVLLNIERTGNTSSASIPIMLDEAARAGTLREGQLVLMLAFGAGTTSASSLLRW